MGFVADSPTSPEPSGGASRFVPDAGSAPAAPDADAGPSILEQLVSRTQRGFQLGGMPGAIMGATTVIPRAWDAATYEAGGKVTDAATALGAPPNVAAGAGYVANVGLNAIPSLASMPVGGGGFAPAMRKSAEGWMTSAVKPLLGTMEKGNAARAISTMLDEGISASSGGVTKLRQQIGALNDEIATAIANSPATVDKFKVASTLNDALKRFEMQVTPQADTKVIEAAWKQFLEHPLLAGVRDIPVQLAQKLKQGTYRTIGSKAYGELGSVETEAQKTLARGLKEGVAEAVPGIAAKNAKEGELINALDIVERQVFLDAKKNPMGLASFAITRPAEWAAFMADRSPHFKSLIARMLNAGQERIPQGVLGLGTAGADSMTGVLMP